MATRLLIVDDSALMRRHLSNLFEGEGSYDVRCARNGVEAVLAVREFVPDVVTLDINMPEMDGLTALAHIMQERPTPVVMVSSLTEQGALATFEALALGAVDYVAKPGGTISLSLDEVAPVLLSKVKAASRARIRRGVAAPSGARPARAERQAAPDTAPAPVNAPAETCVQPSAARARAVQQSTVPVAGTQPRPSLSGVVLIGVSTGGPGTLEGILPQLPADFPYPVIVAQHMPAAFTGPFARRLDAICPLNVTEAGAPQEVVPGNIYIARGSADTVLTTRAGKLTVLARPETQGHLWHPSVELLARTALEQCQPRQLIGVMLTGMGYDGAEAFCDLRRLGGRTIAESEETAVVYGMPKALIDRDGATMVLPAQGIARQLNAWAYGDLHGIH
ncbi:chemotaxis-specific protein-glutamate methyltransferase CheB [Pseudoduganella ginsengisoli]|uniref:Protein-glutamate methylesterase/protein-glutamine glutaminase n=2 Tax=Pseudoduganella ginsengisoli TaxID=1462440 RepID=A0A6L6Q9I4_9BURK|nr:chemotaxis-specific protein-glutamate methyltransferase CheB [Pseudoduganella ginsengisoli]